MRKNKLYLAMAIGMFVLSGCGISAKESNEQGIKLYKEGNYTEALTKFNQAISQDSTSAMYYVNRGMTNLATGEIEIGAEDFQKALELDEECVQAYRGMGIVHMRQEEYEKAIEMFDEAMANTGVMIVDVEYDILEHRAEAEVLLGDYDSAAMTYTSLISLKRHVGENYMKRGLLYVRYQSEIAGDKVTGLPFPEQAKEDFQLALEAEPKNYELYLNIYQNLCRYGYDEIAEEYLQRALALPEETTQDMRAKGKVFFYLGRYQDALTLFLDASDYHDVESYYFIAKCCEQIGDYETALQIYKTVLADEENQTAEAYHLMAGCLIMQGNYRDAKIYIEKAELLDVDYVLRSHILWNKTIMYEKMKDYNAAYETLQAYISYYGMNEDVERELVFIESHL